ncbi:hypothetical protein GGQ74_002177 [Desulfobaculum xiamenense]|uniref:Uncharacterized protein n=1 Tax=Desulfobaculum xiamenense TaxID=995050 RepID=A0A846QTK0_9BACT|nr:hypothetical protein [Desulfobaculum xiamenense]NJB68504.1 hypothetical protein [Desulfobaculum xiamenense]
MHRKITEFFLVIAIVLFTNTYAFATPVYYAGFAFLGDHQFISSNYPYTGVIIKELDAERSLLETSLIKKAQTVDNKNIELQFTSLGDLKHGESISVAIALDWEDVSTEQLEDNLFKTVYNLHGQILLFDFSKMEIIACYPFGTRVTDSSDTEPTEDKKLGIIRNLYLGNIGGINFFDEACTALSHVRLNTGDAICTFKVQNVTLEQKAEDFWASQSNGTPIAAYKTFVAQQFSSAFSKNLNASILPYTKGQAIGGKMAGRFANGDVFQLDIPEADYPIELTIRGFKKVKLDENVTGTSWAYGCFARLRVDSILQESMVDTKLKNAAVKIVPKSQATASDFSAFQESLLSLFNKTTQEIHEQDGKWLKNSAEGEKTRKQFEEFEKTIQKCM